MALDRADDVTCRFPKLNLDPLENYRQTEMKFAFSSIIPIIQHPTKNYVERNEMNYREKF